MKRTVLLIAAIAVAAVGVNAQAKKVNFPKRPIEMVIPFGAGGASDIFARQYSQLTEKFLGKPITTVNKGAAGTIEGMTYAYNQGADGYTVLEITPSLLIIEALKKSPIKFRANFEPLMRVQSDVQLIGVAKNSKFQSFKELIDYAKANPGKKLKIGGLSPGGLDDYIANGLASASGISWTYVPYKSGSEVKAAVLGGELDVYQDKLLSFLPLVESGDIRPLVVLNDTRLAQVPALKDVPCTVELGIKFTQGSWRGFCVKKGTPSEIKQILIDALQKAYETAGYKAMEAKEMTNIRPGYAKAEEFKAIWDSEYNGYVEIFKKTGTLK
ncbi:MAG: tripartite tricarboxylate transporter substrate binding protein [Treponemataceae bacterium]